MHVSRLRFIRIPRLIVRPNCETRGINAAVIVPLLVFRQRVLNNLFPCGEGLNSDSEDDTKGLATESAMLQDVSSKGQKGQKRKRSDEEGRIRKTLF